MALHSVKTLESNVVVPGYGPVPTAQTTVTIDQSYFNIIPASMFSGGHLQDMGFVADPTDGVGTQAPLVAAPAALTSAVAVASPPTKAEYDALRADVNNLRGTVAALLTAITGADKPMSPT